MNRTRFASRLTAVAFLGLVPAATGACGFILSHAPPVGHEQMDSFTCTESPAGPIGEMIYGMFAFATVLDFGAPIGGLAYAGFFSVAAAVGFSKSRKCRAAKRALAQRLSARRDPRAVEAVVQTVVISPATDTLAIGERVQLVATAHSSNGAIVANRMFVWSSSNDAIASVNNAGLVTAHATGAVVIAAHTDDMVGTANIVVAAR